MALNKNAIKLAQMLDLDVKKTEKLMNVMSLSDLAALTTAINSNDYDTVRQIFDRYKHEIDDLPTPGEVKQYYDDQLMQNDDRDEAIASTADFYGIKGEDVENLLGQFTESHFLKKERENLFIPDSGVKEAYENTQEIVMGGKSNGSIIENCKRAWQRRMFLGLLPNSVAEIIQDVIDMSPMAVMQQYAKIHGYGEPAIEESKISLEAMLNDIIEDRLHNIDKDSDDLDDMIITMDMGILEPEDTEGEEEIDKELEKEDSKQGNSKHLIKSIVDKKF